MNYPCVWFLLESIVRLHSRSWWFSLLTRHSDSGSPFRNCALGIAQFRNGTLNLEIAHAQFRNWSYSGTGRNNADSYEYDWVVWRSEHFKSAVQPCFFFFFFFFFFLTTSEVLSFSITTAFASSKALLSSALHVSSSCSPTLSTTADMLIMKSRSNHAVTWAELTKINIYIESISWILF